MRLKSEELTQLLSRKGYSLEGVAPRVRDSEPEPDAVLLPLGKNQDEKGSSGRFRVRITRVGAKLLDADNAAGAVKFILDACRYRGLIPDDSPTAIILEVHQATGKKAERGTLIEIERL